MRIISDFHDYYDRIQVFGQDLSLAYVRKTVDANLLKELGIKSRPKFRGFSRKDDPSFDSIPGLEFPAPRFNSTRSSGHSPMEFGGTFFIVGLAGQVFPGIKLAWQRFDVTPYLDIKVFCYNLDHIDKAVIRNCSKKAQEKYLQPRCSSGKSYRRRAYYIERRIDFDKFYRLWLSENRASKVEALFRQNPLWVIKYGVDIDGECGWYIQYNCPLKDYHFFRVKGPAETYQAISMFLGGLAVPHKAIPVPPDKDMVEIKGFDKYSFRKDKAKK